jgi:hypothetical protein
MGADALWLAEAALEQVPLLGDADFRAAMLGDLARALAGALPADPDRVACTYRALLAQAAAFENRHARIALLERIGDAIVSAALPRPVRGDVLEEALAEASRLVERHNRIEQSRVFLEAMARLRWGEDVPERLHELVEQARQLGDELVRVRTVARIASALAKAMDADRALLALDTMPVCALRAKGFALVVEALGCSGDLERAGTMIDRALAEARGASESPDQATALATLIEVLMKTGLETPSGDAVFGAFDGIEGLRDPALRSDALFAVIEAARGAELDPASLQRIIGRAIHVADSLGGTPFHPRLLEALAVTLGAAGDAALAEAMTLRLIDVSPKGSRPIPVAAVVDALVAASVTDERLAGYALAVIDHALSRDDSETIAGVVVPLGNLFASPALPYEYRVRVLERALTAVRSIEGADARIASATSIVNALSFAGAIERSDAFFAGLVTGADARLGRRAHAERAVALARLHRTAEALGELMEASLLADRTSTADALELARTAARCGFVADALAELARVDGEKQGEAHALLADVFAEAAWLDPHLRALALESLVKTAPDRAKQAVACLLAQIRILEGLGDAKAIATEAFLALDAEGDPMTAGIFRQQLVSALVARLQRLGS